jgi:hypothetical protein
MINEYSMAYTHESEEDLALLTKDFLCCLEGLHEAENFKYAKTNLDNEMFNQFLAPELIDAEALPESWCEKLTTLVNSIEDGSHTMSEIDGVFGVRRARAAYSVSYTQALVCLMVRAYKLNPDKPEPEPYEPVLALLEEPYYYTPFLAAA